jgi:hypothetical protein
MLGRWTSLYCLLRQPTAGMMELADMMDSKSIARKGVWVRVPLPARLGPVGGRVEDVQRRTT